MHRIVLPTRTLGINFEHPTEKIPIPKIGMKDQRRTTCEIFLIIDEKDKKHPKVRPIIHTIVKTHHMDVFNKFEGRRRALIRCLKTLDHGTGFAMNDRLNHKERELLWKQYLSQAPPPSKPNPKKITRGVKSWLQRWCEKLPVEAISELKVAARIKG